MAILGQILARLGHFWALPKIFRNGSDHHRFQHKKYCGFGKFELLRRQSRHFFKIHYTISPYLPDDLGYFCQQWGWSARRIEDGRRQENLEVEEAI